MVNTFQIQTVKLIIFTENVSTLGGKTEEKLPRALRDFERDSLEKIHRGRWEFESYLTNCFLNQDSRRNCGEKLFSGAAPKKSISHHILS